MEVDEKSLVINRKYINQSCEEKPFDALTKKVSETEAWTVSVNGKVGAGWEGEYGSEIEGDILAAAGKLHSKTTFKADVSLGYDRRHFDSKTVEVTISAPSKTQARCTTSQYQIWRNIKVASGSAALPSHRGICQKPKNTGNPPWVTDWNCSIAVKLGATANSSLIDQEDIWLPDVVDANCIENCQTTDNDGTKPERSPEVVPVDDIAR